MARKSKTVLEEVERVPALLTEILGGLEGWSKRLKKALKEAPEGLPDAQTTKQLDTLTKSTLQVSKRMRCWACKVKEDIAALSVNE